jgi:hypothetical protein
VTAYVAVTVDVDQDGMTLKDERNTLTWRAIDIVPKIGESLRIVGARTTWMIRADAQIADVYGEPDGLLTRHRSLWRSLGEYGDEIGWHPHLYRHLADGTYLADLTASECADELRTTHARLKAAGHSFRASRLGEARGANETMRALSDLGIEVDSSALPGRARADSERSFDWSSSPNRPYRPSCTDYRVEGLPADDLLEVPMTTATVRAPYDRTDVRRYLNLAYHEGIFAKAARSLTQEGGHELGAHAFVTTILHPEEAMPREGGHPLYAFRPDALRANLECLVEHLVATCGTVKFITLGEVPSILKAAA